MEHADWLADAAERMTDRLLGTEYRLGRAVQRGDRTQTHLLGQARERQRAALRWLIASLHQALAEACGGRAGMERR